MALKADSGTGRRYVVEQDGSATKWSVSLEPWLGDVAAAAMSLLVRSNKASAWGLCVPQGQMSRMFDKTAGQLASAAVCPAPAVAQFYP
jgi:hypothetical protein